MRIQIAVLGVVLAAVFSSPVLAQGKPDSQSPQYRKWDFGGSLGIFGTSRRDFGGSRAAGRNSEPGLAGNIEVGRYLTTHLKAEAGLMRTTSRSYWDVPSSVSAGQLVSYASRTVHPTSASVAVTYQFFENVFAHPYVSAGIRVTSLAEEQQTYFYGSNSPGFTTRSYRRYTETRPFAAAGYKSYFNERAYMRSELFLAIDRQGASHGALRVGFGIDF